MTSLELIIGFLGVPTLGGLLLIFLSRSRHALDRAGRTSARRVLYVLGWLLLLHALFIAFAGVTLLLTKGILSGWTWIALLARAIGIAVMVIAGRAAFKVSEHRESTDEDPLPVNRIREQADEVTELFTSSLLIVCLPLFIPGLIGLLPLSIFLLLEDLLVGMNRQARENRLLWTLALAVRHQRDLAEDLRAFAISLEIDRHRSWLRWLGLGRSQVRNMDRLASDIDVGLPLSNALMNNATLLAPDLVGTIATAEAAGTLAAVLPDLAARHARRLDTQISTESIYTTAFYLWFVLMTTLFMFTYVLIFIMPKYQSIFRGFGLELPAITLSFIEFGNVLADYWVIILPLMALPTSLMFLSQRFATGNHRYLRWLLRWLPRLEAPYVLTQLAYGVQHQQNLAGQVEILADLERVVPQRHRLECLQLRLESGSPLPAAMEAEGFINKRETAALESASVLGHLPWALQVIGRKILVRRSDSFRWAMKLGEPLLTIAIGAMVAFFCIAMFMPVASLLNSLK